MPYFRILKKENHLSFKVVKDDMKQRRDKEFFKHTGTQVYTGMQGSGKTIGAVRHLWKLKNEYPKMIIVTNLQLSKKYFGLAFRPKDLNQVDLLLEKKIATKGYFFFSTMDELKMLLTSVNNETKGVLYIIDEIHTYFNALDSKNIPMFVFSEISQQRKQRKLIVGTSQLFMRMAKPFREQADSIISCDTKFGVFTIMRAYAGESLETDMKGRLQGKKQRTGWFMQTRKLRSMFDTYQKVVSGREEYERTVFIEKEN